jgi:hypothetical protein
MGMQKSPVLPAFSRADLEASERPTSIAPTRMLWILRTLVAVIGLVAYFWMAIVQVSDDHEEEDPVQCCGTCAPGSGDPIAGMG